MYIIYRHLIKSAVGPFFFGLFTITFLLMIDVLYKYVDLFVSKGVPFLMATKFLLLSLGHTFALSVPMAVLISILMGIGQLAADHEITAMKACGISLWSVLRPLLISALLIGAALAAYNHYIFPESNHTLANLAYDINRKKPMLEIQEQQFNELNGKMTIYVQKKNDITGEIRNVTIIEKEKPGELGPRTTLATWGRIIPDHENNSLLIELHDGEIHDRPDKESPDKFQVIRFGQHNIYIANAERDFESSGRKARSDREMNLRDLWDAAASEREHRMDVEERVADLGTHLVNWQFQLLDPSRRIKMVGAIPASEATRNNQNRLRGKFKALLTKVQRARDQAGYQQKIADSYHVKESRYMVEFHKKFAIPFACVVFALLGVPMAVTASRSGKGVSVSMAILIYTLYYLFLVGGEKFADRGRLDPMLAMWSANFVLLALGIPIFFRTVKEGALFRLPVRQTTDPNSDSGATT